MVSQTTNATDDHNIHSSPKIEDQRLFIKRHPGKTDGSDLMETIHVAPIAAEPVTAYLFWEAAARKQDARGETSKTRVISRDST